MDLTVNAGARPVSDPKRQKLPELQQTDDCPTSQPRESYTQTPAKCVLGNEPLLPITEPPRAEPNTCSAAAACSDVSMVDAQESPSDSRSISPGSTQTSWSSGETPCSARDPSQYPRLIWSWFLNVWNGQRTNRWHLFDIDEESLSPFWVNATVPDGFPSETTLWSWIHKSEISHTVYATAIRANDKIIPPEAYHLDMDILTQPKQLESYPSVSVKDRLFCVVKVQGTLPDSDPIECIMLVDTGAQITRVPFQIFQRLWKFLKQDTHRRKVTPQTSIGHGSGSVPGFVYQCKILFEQCLIEQKVLTIGQTQDDGSIPTRHHSEAEVYGLLGLDFLSKCALQINGSAAGELKAVDLTVCETEKM